MTGNVIGWKLTITAEADTRPGTPEEIELARWRAELFERHGRQAFDPDPPADDELTCRDCNTWREYRHTPGVYAWFIDCPPTCGHGCHDFDPVGR